MQTRVHLNVTETSESERFFADTLGGSRTRDHASRGRSIRFSNATLLLRRQPPTGGTKGTTVNHIAFGVPDIRAMVKKVKTAGFPLVTRAEVPPTLEVQDDLCFMADQSTFVAFMMAPDDTKVEFIEIPAQVEPIRLHHIHFAGPSVPEMKAWYVAALGATPGKRGNFEAADLPCVNLTYSPSPSAVSPTRGRALDRIGFEVDGLETFRKRLEVRGITMSRVESGAVMVTDPWGTDIELSPRE